MITVTVSADALCEVLQALVGPPHHIRELQALSSLSSLVGNCPIKRLIKEYNEALEAERRLRLSGEQNG